MADVSARFALPFLQAGQAQKEITHNGAIDRIDALLQLAVASRALTEPPASPLPGTSWIIAADPGGAWNGRVGQIVTASDGGWIYVTPRDGCVAWIADEAVFGVYYDGMWHGDGWPVTGLKIAGQTVLTSTAGAIAAPVGGATVDSEARLAISTILAALRTLGLIAASA
jgi:hypothetical protein